MKKYKKFKNNEKTFDLIISSGQLYIVRFDGKGMTKYFKIKKQAVNNQFFNTMKLTFTNFLKKHREIIFAYSFSDEISVLIKSPKVKSDFSRIQKVLSLLSGQLAIDFYKAAKKYSLDDNFGGIFDARIIPVNKEEIFDYFKARQAFAIDKYIMQLKGEYG